MSEPEKTNGRVRREAAQELVSELRSAELKWDETTEDVLGLKRNPKAIWEALISERIETDRLMQWVDDLQSGMYLNCVYCGLRYRPGMGAQVTMAEVLKRHLAECPKHPMSELLACLEGALLSVLWRVEVHAPYGYYQDPETFAALNKFAVRCGAAISSVKARRANGVGAVERQQRREEQTFVCQPCMDGCHTQCWDDDCECAHSSHYPETSA